jgi:hypothetical protein
MMDFDGFYEFCEIVGNNDILMKMMNFGGNDDFGGNGWF